MSCKACASSQKECFSGELAIHFPGRDGLTKPLVWVFPRLEVCLVCGATNFTVPEQQLKLLQEGVDPRLAEGWKRAPQLRHGNQNH